MKTIYFDTYVYNKLIDNSELRGKILSLKRYGKIDVIFSEYLFNELVCTLRKEDNQPRGQRLFQLVLELISGRVVKLRATLINEEIEAFLNNSKSPSIFVSKEDAGSLIHVMGRLAKGDKITNAKPLNDILIEKNEDYEELKGIWGKHKFIIKEVQKIYSYADFEAFYDDNKKHENDFTKRLLSEKIIKNPSVNDIERVQKNIDNLKYFKAYCRMHAAYNFLCIFKKPQRGDSYDLKHFISASSFDILISDFEFLDILRWTFPQQICTTFDKFLNLF